jgi:hypothetical protein
MIFFGIILQANIYAKGGTEISIEYTHSRRIEYNNIAIMLKYVDTVCQMNIKTLRMDDKENIRGTSTEKTIDIDEQYFDMIYTKILELNFKDIITQNKNIIGADGETIRIKIGAPAATLDLTIWSPGLDTQKRKTEDLNAIIQELFMKAELAEWL